MVRIKQKYSTTSMKQKYYQIILDRIIHSHYKSNDIITIQSLISEFGVSKTPIREALLELCDEGLLRSIPKFGYEVVSLENDYINEIFEFRFITEIGAMEKYFPLLQDKNELLKLSALVQEADDVYDNNTPFENWKVASNFHLELIDCYKNEFLYKQMENVLKYLGIAYARSYWENGGTAKNKQSNEYHKLILNSIKENDKEKAIAFLKEDLKNYKNIWEINN